MSARRYAPFIVLLASAALLGGVIGAAAFGAPKGNAAQPTNAPASATASPAAVHYEGEMALDPREGAMGSTVTASGSGFSAGATMELVWQGFSGQWLVDNSDANFKGRTYTEELSSLGSVTVNGQGRFSTTFVVPEGFGFSHDVRLVQGDVVRNQATFKVDMEVSVSPKSGPVGTPITIEAKGIGVTGLTRSWLVTYDNHFTGWLSAVTTSGTARAVIPATGGPGEHVIKIIHGSFTFPYLNPKQSPDPTRPTFTEIITVTDAAPILPAAADTQAIVARDDPGRPTTAGAKVWLDTTEAIVGDRLTLAGAELPPNTALTVTWETQIGVDTQIIGSGGQARPDFEWPIGEASTDVAGNFVLPFEVPVDKGGAHQLLIRAGDTILATTSVRVRPSAAALTPTQGPVGTVMTINITGVDDTDTGKIFMTVYDNAMLGYSCSVTAQGQITIELPAAGAPGMHYIDLYPGIYKGDDLKDVYNYRIPQLTFAADHPGEVLPAFHFAFEVTP